MDHAPTIKDINALRDSLGSAIYRTPIMRCAVLEEIVGGNTQIHAKLEFLQRTGTFKARGALAVVSGLTSAQRKRGITAVSAGNHAIAAAYAAKSAGVSAKVVMIGSANPSRIASCKALGAEVILVDRAHDAFEAAEQIQSEEGRFFVHPFEGPQVATGTGMVGLEIHEQCPEFDVVVVSVGGGGFIGGISNALKQLRPECEVIGVEPEGADSMHRSFAAGEPRAIERVDTIADSLGAPFAMPYSFDLCRKNVDELELINDDQLRKAMGILFQKMKLAVEPACAASTAALLGPLRESLRGKTVVLVFCGSNVDWDTFASQMIIEDAHAD